MPFWQSHGPHWYQGAVGRLVAYLMLVVAIVVALLALVRSDDARKQASAENRRLVLRVCEKQRDGIAVLRSLVVASVGSQPSPINLAFRKQLAESQNPEIRELLETLVAATSPGTPPQAFKDALDTGLKPVNCMLVLNGPEHPAEGG